ncbi:MAG: thioredoxin domain-containing protein [Myxococcota bacterium]|nr:thioredoxin domain-containing protein [Myxococcota bacterium]
MHQILSLPAQSEYGRAPRHGGLGYFEANLFEGNTMRTLKSTVLVTCVALVWACNPAQKQVGQPAQAANPSGDTVVAEVTSKKITLAEVDKTITRELDELEEKRYELREKAIQNMVLEELLTQEAKKLSLADPDAVVKKQLEGKKAPTDEEIKAFFETRVKPQVGPTATLEKFRERIVGFLGAEADKKILDGYFTGLKAAANIKITLTKPDRPRVEIAKSGPSKGQANAPITIVEFADFECPYCSQMGSRLSKVVDTYPGKVQVFYKHFPLAFHKNARKAAEASLCADEQKAFWKFHDVLYANQRGLGDDKYADFAKEAGLDEASFQACMSSGKFKKQVEADYQEGKKIGVQGTPSVYINGLLTKKLEPEQLITAVADELKKLETAAK